MLQENKMPSPKMKTHPWLICLFVLYFSYSISSQKVSSVKSACKMYPKCDLFSPFLQLLSSTKLVISLLQTTVPEAHLVYLLLPLPSSTHSPQTSQRDFKTKNRNQIMLLSIYTLQWPTRALWIKSKCCDLACIAPRSLSRLPSPLCSWHTRPAQTCLLVSQ